MARRHNQACLLRVVRTHERRCNSRFGSHGIRADLRPANNLPFTFDLKS